MTNRPRVHGAYAALLCVVTLIWSATAFGQLLTQTTPGLPNARASATAWGDIDNDGDLDLALSGQDSTGQAFTKIFKNSGGVLTVDATQQITGILWGGLAWGDFDNDGLLDLAITGQGQEAGLGSVTSGVSEVYRNVAGVLTKDPAQILGPPPFFDVKLLRYSSLAWVDFTNDGKLDLMIAGIDRNGFVTTRLYINQNNVLTENSSQSVIAIRNGAVSWGDFNGDGLPDLAVMGLNDQGLRSASVYLNRNGLLIESSDIRLAGVYGGDLSWGDYDGDGHLDLAISGWDENWNAVLDVYHNNSLRGTLEKTFSLTTGGRGLVGSLSWGDYDNDGDLDLAVSGRDEFTNLSTVVFDNNGASFTPAGEPGLVGVMNGSVAWGDVNGDSRLDLLVTGEKNDGHFLTTIYTNSGAVNTAPTPPTLRPPVVTSGNILFRWQESSDTESSASRLSYNLRLGTTSRGNELISSGVVGAGPGKGTEPGNVGQTLIKSFNIPVGIDSLFWSLQAVDAGFERSAFAAEDTIIIQRLVDSKQQLVGLRQTILGQGVAWGDFDNDGFPDLALAGRDINGDARTLIYHNENGTLTQDNVSTLNGLLNGALAWGDYDRDGDLDLFRSGEDRFNNGFTFLYRNNDGVFRSDSVQAYIANLNLRQGGGAWGDYNNDGRLDLAASGLSRSGLRTTVLYKNVPGDTLVPDNSQTLTGTANGQLVWGDIDNDGDLDLIISGESGTPSQFIPIIEVYRNDGGKLTKYDAQSLTGLFSTALALGDMDNDGDLDLVAIGGTLAGLPTATVYTNDGLGNFTAGSGLRGALGGTVALGDVDNNGYLDIFLTGQNSNSDLIAVLYQNADGVFSEIPLPVVPGNIFSGAGWADYDRDKDLDLAVTGGTGATFLEISKVYDNLTGQTKPNRLPVAPESQNSVSKGNTVALSWSNGTDLETEPAGLAYSLRVGTSPGSGDIVSGLQAVGVGVLGHTNVDTLRGLADSTYYWSVRSIDAGFGISPEAAERTFEIDTTPPGIASISIDPPIAGIGAVVTVVLNLVEKNEIDNSVDPNITFKPKQGGSAIPVDKLSFSGKIWTGKVTINATITSDTMLIGVSGVQDLQGNVSASNQDAARFIVDTNIPAVVQQFPLAGQKGVPAASTIKATFSKAINPASLTSETFKMRRTDNGTQVSGTIVYISGTKTAQFTPGGRLDPDKEYEVTVGAAVTDSIGNRLTADLRWTFSTATQVSAANGGRLTASNIILYIPPKALDEGSEVSLEDVKVDSLVQTTPRFINARTSRNLVFVGPAVRLTPIDAVLPPSKPGTLTFLNGNEPNLSQVDETKLGIFREVSPGSWESIGGSVNVEANSIVTAVDRLGVYGVFEDAAGTESELALSAFRAQPRVFSPKKLINQRFNTSEASVSFKLGQSLPVTVEVYNIAGRLERVLCRDKVMGPGTMVEFWDGKDSDNRFCGSGLYIVVIEAGDHKEKLTISVLND